MIVTTVSYAARGTPMANDNSAPLTYRFESEIEVQLYHQGG